MDSEKAMVSGSVQPLDVNWLVKIVAELYSPPHQMVLPSGENTGDEWKEPLKNDSPNL